MVDSVDILKQIKTISIQMVMLSDKERKIVESYIGEFITYNDAVSQIEEVQKND